MSAFDGSDSTTLGGTFGPSGFMPDPNGRPISSAARDELARLMRASGPAFIPTDSGVKATYTPKQAARIIERQAATIEKLRDTIADRRPKRSRQSVETTGPRGFIPAAARFIRAAGKRAGEGDEFELAELVGLQAVLDAAIATAVQGQRTYGKSWAHIGRAVGTTREAAWQRWGKA